MTVIAQHPAVDIDHGRGRDQDDGFAAGRGRRLSAEAALATTHWAP